MVIDFLMSHRDPLQSNGHGFSHHWGLLRGNGHLSLYIKILCEAMVIDFLCYIEALCEAMVIDLFTWKPSVRSSISLHQDPLWGNDHRFLYIKTLCKAMVIDSFTSRPSARHWSLISLFTSRPSVRQWSLISLSHWGPLRSNDWSIFFWYIPSPWDWSKLFFFFKKSEKKITKQSDLSYRDPLHGNGHWIFWI